MHCQAILPGCVSKDDYSHRVRLQWSAKAFEAESFHLPMGHGQKFPVICLSLQGWANFWAADLLLFPGVASCSGRSFCPQEKFNGLVDTISIDP